MGRARGAPHIDAPLSKSFACASRVKIILVVRDEFQAKYGQGDALVALLRELEQTAPPPSPFRSLVDASGPCFTVVTETAVADFAGWQNASEKEMAAPLFGDWFRRMTEVVESGRREFYTLAAP